MAGILHDDAIQRSEQLNRSLGDLLEHPQLPTDTLAGLQDAVELSHTLLLRLRAAAADLYPPPLDIVGFIPALQSLLHATQQRTGMHCKLQGDIALSGRCLDRAREILLFAAVGEAIRNAVQHAEAARLTVSIRSADGQLSVTIQDDGSGFIPISPDERLAAGHLGLALLDGHIQELYGTLLIESSPGQGTTITARVPIDVAYPAEERTHTLKDVSDDYSHRRGR